MKKLYIMLTKTESVFCTLIKSYTREPYAHVSILFSNDFKFGYSFSRRNIKNPFIGGFMREDYIKWTDQFPQTECQVYELETTDEKYTMLYNRMQEYYAEKEKYKYNFVGVIGYLFKLKIEPKNRYFCSQFATYILGETDILHLDKEPICTTAGDFKKHKDLSLIYEGNLRELVDHPTLRLDVTA
ncbi:MAG: hypothetical protein RR324_05725 [Cellulosilyticaceae bacterium]